MVQLELCFLTRGLKGMRFQKVKEVNKKWFQKVKEVNEKWFQTVKEVNGKMVSGGPLKLQLAPLHHGHGEVSAQTGPGFHRLYRGSRGKRGGEVRTTESERGGRGKREREGGKAGWAEGVADGSGETGGLNVAGGKQDYGKRRLLKNRAFLLHQLAPQM